MGNLLARVAASCGGTTDPSRLNLYLKGCFAAQRLLEDGLMISESTHANGSPVPGPCGRHWMTWIAHAGLILAGVVLATVFGRGGGRTLHYISLGAAALVVLGFGAQTILVLRARRQRETVAGAYVAITAGTVLVFIAQATPSASKSIPLVLVATVLFISGAITVLLDLRRQR